MSRRCSGSNEASRLCSAAAAAALATSAGLHNFVVQQAAVGAWQQCAQVDPPAYLGSPLVCDNFSTTPAIVCVIAAINSQWIRESGSVLCTLRRHTRRSEQQGRS